MRATVSALVLGLGLACAPAMAGLPGALRPIVLEPPFSFSERVFDLDPALAKARETKKPVFLYLGAEDCAPCRVYGSFLDSNLAQLSPSFDQFVLVELRTWLRGSKLVFVMNQRRYSYTEFQAAIGDQTKGLRYPAVWVISGEGKLIKQLAASEMSGLSTLDGSLRLMSLP